MRQVWLLVRDDVFLLIKVSVHVLAYLCPFIVVLYHCRGGTKQSPRVNLVPSRWCWPLNLLSVVQHEFFRLAEILLPRLLPNTDPSLLWEVCSCSLHGSRGHGCLQPSMLCLLVQIISTAVGSSGSFFNSLLSAIRSRELEFQRRPLRWLQRLLHEFLRPFGGALSLLFLLLLHSLSLLEFACILEGGGDVSMSPCPSSCFVFDYTVTPTMLRNLVYGSAWNRMGETSPCLAPCLNMCAGTMRTAAQPVCDVKHGLSPCGNFLFGQVAGLADGPFRWC